jgi:pectin methylesterase-like acyl-CoA thioesterase
VYGALKSIAASSGEYTINVAPGIYTELVHYVGSANVTINGTGTANYGSDVVIQYTNCNDMNGGTHTRASFYFSGANLVLKNLTLKNTTVRGERYLTGVAPSNNSQAETIFFANGTGRTMAAYNCSFLSHQDTIQTTGKNWFYKCYIEGDTDYIWGTADVCLLEDCELVSVNDPKKTNNKEAILLVARTGTTGASSIAKGYVILNSRVKTEAGMTTYFGRNPGAGAYYDQCAVVNTIFTNDGTGTIGATIWKGDTYTFLEGAAEHVGWKVYGNTVGGSPQNTSGKLGNTSVIDDALYQAEYSGRNTILNRVYTPSTRSYGNAASVWNIATLKTDFGAPDDPIFGGP